MEHGHEGNIKMDWEVFFFGINLFWRHGLVVECPIL